jgi:hypothetical protein
MEEFAKTVWNVREKMIRGTFIEPPSISTLIWSNDETQIDQNVSGRCTSIYSETPVYPIACTMKGIPGRELEQCKAEFLLEESETLGRRVAIVATIAPGWLYGQCSYKRDPDDVGVYKFCTTPAALATQRVLHSLRRDDSLAAIILYNKIEAVMLQEQLNEDGLVNIAYYWDQAESSLKSIASLSHGKP